MGGCGSKTEPPVQNGAPNAASRDGSVITGAATTHSDPQLTLSSSSVTGGSELYNLCNIDNDVEKNMGTC